MTSFEPQLIDVVDISRLNIRTDDPNGSTTRIEKIRNMNLSNSITLTNVFLVVSDFLVNHLYDHKLCK